MIHSRPKKKLSRSEALTRIAQATTENQLTLSVPWDMCPASVRSAWLARRSELWNKTEAPALDCPAAGWGF